jgi:hypothetical protein
MPRERVTVKEKAWFPPAYRFSLDSRKTFNKRGCVHLKQQQVVPKID